jgi:glycerol-3-phosphate cytidylyltransferase-like family protein
VLPDAPWITGREWIEEHDIQIVAHGDDYSAEQLKGTHSALIELGILRSVHYTPGISTTDIIRRCQEQD